MPVLGDAFQVTLGVYRVDETFLLPATGPLVTLTAHDHRIAHNNVEERS